MTDLKDSNGSVNKTTTACDDISLSPNERRGYKRRLEDVAAKGVREPTINKVNGVCDSEVIMSQEESAVMTSLGEDKGDEVSPGGAVERSNTTTAAGALESMEDPDEATNGAETQASLPDGMVLEWNSEKTSAVLTVAERLSNSGDRELRVCLVGRAKIRMMQGSAKVLGHALESRNETIHGGKDLDGSVVVTSPYWSSWMTIEANPQALPCKILMECIRGPESFWVTSPKRPIILPQSWRTCADGIVRDFCASSPSDYSNAYSRIADSLEDYGSANGRRSRALDETRRICMITGAKGVGKSTMLRYLTNRILSAPSSRGRNPDDNHSNDTSGIEEVAILDTDVGQPELAPPGLLSLSIVRKPLLQPPYWNLVGVKTMKGEEKCSISEGNNHSDEEQPEGYSYGSQLEQSRLPRNELESDAEEGESDGVEVVSSVFFGASTSKVDPTRYIDAIQFLMEKYKTEVIHDGGNPIPLLINMDGWVKGVGYEILSALIESLEPTHIVQILGDTPGQTFDLPPSILESTKADVPLDAPAEMEDSSVLPKVYKLQACQIMSGASLCRIPAFTTRNFRWATYFLPNELQTIDAWDFASAKSLQTGWIVATNSDKTTTVPHWWHTNSTIGHSGDNDDMVKASDEDTDGSELNDDCRLAKALARERPYCVPMEALDAFVIGSDFEDYLRLPEGESNSDIVDETYYRIFQALNGRVVALCTNTSTMESLGYGILRSIDWGRRLLYILVPPPVVAGENQRAPSLALSRVKALVGGNLPLPLAMLYRGVYAESFPYLTTISKQAVLGSEPMKSRNSIGRRGLANAERKTN